jgi:hypothetical protein
MSGKEAWPKVAIIVLNWNGWRDTIECLGSYKDSTNFDAVKPSRGKLS